MANEPSSYKWLLFIPDIPARPSSPRVKIWRKLQKIGAVAIKNGVYILPFNKDTEEDFIWLKAEVEDSGGTASIFEAYLGGDIDDKDLFRLFNTIRDKDYSQIIKEGQGLMDKIESSIKTDQTSSELLDRYSTEFERLKVRIEQVQKIDFFGAPNREKAERICGISKKALERLRKTIFPSKEKVTVDDISKLDPKAFKKRLWITRKGLHIDRLACAWLIRRFIDPEARFSFVGKEEEVEKGGILFDIYGAQLGHHGEDCSFETFLKVFDLTDSGLKKIAEIVHDIDLKDEKFARDEAYTLARILEGLCKNFPDDYKRIEAGEVIFDALYSALTNTPLKF